jgi:hypothetical protein
MLIKGAEVPLCKSQRAQHCHNSNCATLTCSWSAPRATLDYFRQSLPSVRTGRWSERAPLPLLTLSTSG